MVPPSEDNQIKKMLSKYKNMVATKKDVVSVLMNYRGLSYHMEKFVFNDGTSKELFNLSGTIPVVYKNNTYHIPIMIWVMDTHPNNAPLCFVKPTPQMEIRVSMYVDHNGKIYLPYLHDWQPQSSDLLGLIQVMIVTFGECPPVYSKPKNYTTPYPANETFMPTPNAASNPYNSYSNFSQLPYPIQNSNPNTGFHSQMPKPAQFGGYPGTGNPNANSSFMPDIPEAAKLHGYPGAGSSNTNSNFMADMPEATKFHGYPGYPSTAFGNYPPTNQTGTITEEHIKLSLVSAVEDKLKRRIQERVNQSQAEIQTLNRTKLELNEGRSKIESIIASLEKDEAEMKKSISILQEKQRELEKTLETLENSDGVDPDEAVFTTAPLYKQLLNAYAEEAATEDAIYYLGEGLRANVIDLEAFLKHVRQLSRKQFMLRATMQKCRQKAGLAG